MNCFKIVTLGKPSGIGEDNTFKVLSEDEIAALDDEAKANYEAEIQELQTLKSSTRWILPPQSQVVLAIEFASEQTGKSDSVLDFEVVGSERTFSLSLCFLSIRSCPCAHLKSTFVLFVFLFEVHLATAVYVHSWDKFVRCKQLTSPVVVCV